jgi:hypothetical protein
MMQSVKCVTAINSRHEAAQMSSVSSCGPLPIVRFHFIDQRFTLGNLEWTEIAHHIALHIPDKYWPLNYIKVSHIEVQKSRTISAYVCGNQKFTP